MFNDIVGSIICTEFDRKYGRYNNSMSDKYNAMKITFNLNPNFKIEDGYRKLEILIYGGGTNYFGVYARTTWNVIRNEWSDGEELIGGHDYVEGMTPWLLYGYHASCWREAVSTLIRQFEDRISHIDTIFSNNGWYSNEEISSEYADNLHNIRRGTPGYGRTGNKRVRLEDLDFQFPTKEEV